MRETTTNPSKKNRVLLWIAQVLLAALFLFAGVMKLVIPVAEMEKQSNLPGLLIHIIGVCEILGALGVILPGLFRVRPALTSLAAFGLMLLMLGATAITIATNGFAAAMFPLVTGLICAAVAYGRSNARLILRSART